MTFCPEMKMKGDHLYDISTLEPLAHPDNHRTQARTKEEEKSIEAETRNSTPSFRTTKILVQQK
jgi:hypothetical protein